MNALDWLVFAGTLGGAILGPFLAVLVTRLVDEDRARRERREAVFVALMTTRRAALTPEHVQAVNRIEIEFSGDASVMTQLRAYMNVLEEPWPAEQAPQDLITRRRRRAFADLVQAIAANLGRRIDRLDIIEGGYHPGGWAESEALQLGNLRLVNAILRGDLAFPIRVGPNRPPPPPPPPSGPHPGEDGSPFPPAP